MNRIPLAVFRIEDAVFKLKEATAMNTPGIFGDVHIFFVKLEEWSNSSFLFCKRGSPDMRKCGE